MAETHEEPVVIDINVNDSNGNGGEDGGSINCNDDSGYNNGDDNSIKTTSSAGSFVKNTSKVWDHFDKINENGQTWGKCRHCS